MQHFAMLTIEKAAYEVQGGTSMLPSNYEDTLLIFDVDDNLYSWCDSFVPAFIEDMLPYILEQTGWPEDQTREQFRLVHLEHHDTEYGGYATSLKEIPFFLDLQKANPQRAEELYQGAKAAFEQGMTKYLHLFDGVPEALENLRKMRTDIQANGKRCEIIALTDARTRAMMKRLETLGMFGDEPFFDHVYCRHETDTPALPRASWEKPEYLARFTERPRESKKPQKALIEQVMQDRGFTLEEHKIWYSGDSRSSDVLMANLAAVRVAWNSMGAKSFQGKRLADLLSINGLSSSHDEMRALLREVDGVIQPDLQFEHMQSGFMPMLMHTDAQGKYERPRTPTPTPDRQQALLERQAFGERIIERFNTAAEREGKAHLKL